MTENIEFYELKEQSPQQRRHRKHHRYEESSDEHSSSLAQRRRSRRRHYEEPSTKYSPSPSPPSHPEPLYADRDYLVNVSDYDSPGCWNKYRKRIIFIILPLILISFFAGFGFCALLAAKNVICFTKDCHTPTPSDILNGSSYKPTTETTAASTMTTPITATISESANTTVTTPTTAVTTTTMTMKTTDTTTVTTTVAVVTTMMTTSTTSVWLSSYASDLETLFDTISTTASNTLVPSVSTMTTVEEISLEPSETTNIPTTVSKPAFNKCNSSPASPTYIELLFLNKPSNLSNYTYFRLPYKVEGNVNVIILQFEFTTKYNCSWYLDDVSMKEKNGDGTELIQNGGFENPDIEPEWTQCNTASPTVFGSVDHHYPHSGDYCYKSIDWDVISFDVLFQRVNVTSGSIYEIEFYIFHSRDPDWMRVTVIS